MTRPCSCHEHADVASTPTEIGNHCFDITDRPDNWWRWRCSCGKGGQWQGQSPSVSYHAWLRHVERHSPKEVPAGTCCICGETTSVSAMCYRNTNVCSGRCDAFRVDRSE